MPASKAMTIWNSLQIPRSYLLALTTGSSRWRLKPWRCVGVHNDLEILSSTQESIFLLTVFQVQFPIYQKRKRSNHQAEKNTKPWRCPDFYQFVFLIVTQSGYDIQSHHFMENRWGKKETMTYLFSQVPKSLWTVSAAMKLKEQQGKTRKPSTVINAKKQREKNRMERTRDLFKKIRVPWEYS